MSTEPLWQRTEPSRFRFRFWNDDLTANVYDLRSGETHLLSTLALELLHLLDSGVTEAPEMAASLAEVLNGPEAAVDLVRDEMRRLQRIGLAEIVR